ncbi:hypothetical protein HDU96_003198 [Phlyctochytrium bullatum]|nr:hypothetical protein HDU96_003198 [Phlyctochytrium bullatum]
MPPSQEQQQSSPSPSPAPASPSASTTTPTSPSAAAFPITPEYVAFLNDRLSTLTPQEIVDWAVVSLPGLVQTTAFGLTGLAIRDMISKSKALKSINGDVPLVFVDTLYHFKETIDLAHRVAAKYSTKLHMYKPYGFDSAASLEAAHGEKLWETSPDIYDYVVKVEPARRAAEDLGAQTTITGRRRSQGAERASIPILEIDSSVSPPALKLNVLAAWDYKQVWSYIIKNDVPYNPLHDQGYKSIGDWHSTQPTGAGEGEREGRWKGQGKTECGLHKDYFVMKSKFESAITSKKRKADSEGVEQAEAKAAKVDA